MVVVGDLIGSGSAQEQAVVGETPNHAARLQGIAEPNTVDIAEGTLKLLGHLFELDDLGLKDLKGVAGPVRARAAAVVAVRVPLPDPQARSGRSHETPRSGFLTKLLRIKSGPSAGIAIPKRFALLCVLPTLLSTSPHAQSQTASPETIWDHNGSVMYLVANGSSREFYYQKPRPGMLEAGARAGTLLFRGQINNGQFSGTAYLFNAPCGQVPFQVKGPILDNSERVLLTGQAPRVGRGCRTYGYYASNLEFRLLKPSEVAQSQQTMDPNQKCSWRKDEMIFKNRRYRFGGH